MKVKKILSGLLAAMLLVSSLSGCGQKSEPESKQPATNQPATSESTGGEESTGGIVTIEFWNSAEGAMATSLEYLVNEFNNTVGKEKGIVVNAVFQGSDVMEKLKTLAQAQDFANFPDVGQIYSGGISSLVKMEPLLYMDDVYASGKYDIQVAKEDIISNFLRNFTFEGKLVGMPLNASTLLMYYNKDAAKEANLDPEAPPTTIEELAEWTKALTLKAADGTVERYGMNIQIDRYEFVNFLAGVNANGCNYIGDNGGGRDGVMTKLTIGEDGSLRKFLTEWEKVIATGGYKPVNDDERGEFANGLSAINFQSSAQLATMIGNTEGKFELGVAPLPKCTKEDFAGAAVGGGSLCMFDLGDETRKEAAFTFVQYMASPESQLYLFMNNGYLPVTEKAYELDEYKKFIEEQPLAKVAEEQMRNSHTDMQEPFDLINWELNTLVKENMIKFANGEITLDECHDTIVDEFNAKLTEYLRANG